MNYSKVSNMSSWWGRGAAIYLLIKKKKYGK